MIPVNDNLFGSITRLIDQHVPDLVRPAVPPDVTFQGEEEQYDLNLKRLRVYAKESPFTATQVKNIIHNMAMTEALTSPKASDRLAALTLVGKGTKTEYFTAEKREIILSAENLKLSITDKLERLFGDAVLEGEFTEVVE